MLDTAIQHHQNNEFDKAAGIYEELLRQNSSDPDVLYLYALLLTQLGRHNESVEYYYKALRFDFNQIEIFNRLLEIYNHNNDIEKIIYCYLQLIELEPQNPYHYFNAGINYYKKGDGENAYKAYMNAIHLKPDFAEALLNIGSLYQQIRDFKNAENHLLKALEFNPNMLELYLNLGNLYVDTAETQKAVEISEKGLLKSPNNQSFLFNKTRALFLQGNMETGWDYFKYRRIVSEKKGLKTYLLDYNGSLKNKNVLVYYDSGFGDSLQFLRYVHLLKEQGAKVLLKVQPALINLVETSDFGVDILPETQDVYNTPHDLQVNLTSLAYPYRSFPCQDSYISIPQDKIDEMRTKYFNNDNYKVGLVWRSHANSYGQQNINDIMTFYPLAKLEGVKLYSFQQLKGQPWLDNLPEDFRIEALGDSFKDFSETAAALQNLDLLITSDNAVAHLAGSMGKKVWTLIPTVPNWRWTMTGSDTPWYNSMKLYRQATTGDWASVIERMVSDLRQEL